MKLLVRGRWLQPHAKQQPWVFEIDCGHVLIAVGWRHGEYPTLRARVQGLIGHLQDSGCPVKYQGGWVERIHVQRTIDRIVGLTLVRRDRRRPRETPGPSAK